MPLFSAAALRSLRDLNRKALDSLASIEREVVSSAPGGGANTGAKVWTTIDGGDAVPCRLAPDADGGVTIQAGQLTTPDKMLVVFDVDSPDIVLGDRITVSGADLDGTEWIRVLTVLTPKNPRTNSTGRAYVCLDVSPTGA